MSFSNEKLIEEIFYFAYEKGLEKKLREKVEKYQVNNPKSSMVEAYETVWNKINKDEVPSNL